MVVLALSAIRECVIQGVRKIGGGVIAIAKTSFGLACPHECFRLYTCLERLDAIRRRQCGDADAAYHLIKLGEELML
jgi:hypothetical protein